MKQWGDCLFIEGREAITKYFSSKDNVLLVIGKGFDPRSCSVLEVLKPVIPDLSVWLIDYNDSPKKEDKKNLSRSEENLKRILELCNEINMQEKKVPLYGSNANERTLVISESVRNVFNKNEIQEFNHLLIDVSAMPRSVAFSIINIIISNKKDDQSIYILTSENSDFDDKIIANIGDGNAQYLPGFNTFSMYMESENDENIIWLPILGVNEMNSFQKIVNYLKPIEICPVVPFPSKNVRRSENILRLYGQILFRENNIEKRNIIYVPEKHPVLVYQKLYDTVKYYEKAFELQKENHIMKYAFSSQSSKLIDIGVLLTVINLNKEGIRTGIVVVENQGYTLQENYCNTNEVIYCLCLNENEFNW